MNTESSPRSTTWVHGLGRDCAVMHFLDYGRHSLGLMIRVCGRWKMIQFFDLIHETNPIISFPHSMASNTAQAICTGVVFVSESFVTCSERVC